MECNQYFNLFTNYYKSEEFKWTKEQTKKIEKMKHTITNQLEITTPDTSKTFYILTNASNTGIGAALLQKHSTKKKINLILAN